MVGADRCTARPRTNTHLEHFNGRLGELRAAAQECRKSRIDQVEEEAQLCFVERAPVRVQEIGSDDFRKLEHAGHPAVVGIHAAQVQAVAYCRSARGQSGHGLGRRAAMGLSRALRTVQI